MKQIWDLCAFEMTRVLKKPQNYIWMILMPILFTLLFGSLLGGSPSKPVLALVDQDHSMVSARFTEDINGSRLYNLKAASLSTAKQWLNDKKVSGIIIIPQDFQANLVEGKKPTITFRHGPDFDSSAIAIKQVLNNTVDQFHIEVTGATYGKKVNSNVDWRSLYQSIDKEVQSIPSTIKVESVTENKNQLTMGETSARSAGFAIMFVMIVMMSVTGALLDAKKTGVWYRMMATPSSRFQISAGYFLSFFLIGWFQFALLMAASSLLFGVHWGNLEALIVLVSAILLAVVGLGLFIAGLVKTTEQQAAVGNIIVASTCMLGGVYWPLDIVPKVMQKIAYFVPQKWAMDGFTEIIARGGSLPDIILPVSVLLGFAAVFIGVGMSRIKYE